MISYTKCYTVHVWLLFFRCVDMVKGSQYVELANDLEINKAITYLRQKDFNQVTVCLNSIEGNTTQFRFLWSVVVATIVAKEGELQTSHPTVNILLPNLYLELNQT